MHKTVLILSVTIMFAACAPVKKVNEGDARASINYYEFTNDGSGNYNFRFRTSNGLFREETGKVVNAGKEDEHIVVHGAYSYIDANGDVQEVSYIADENGYQLQEPSVGIITAGVPPAVVASLLG